MERVLFVDDERSVLAALERMLAPYADRWEMEFAQGGAQALVTLAAQPVDVLVTDMRMPGIDGAALLEVVRDRHPDTTRIILSAEAEGTGANKPAADEYLHKPCRAGEIIDALDRASASRATRRRRS